MNKYGVKMNEIFKNKNEILELANSCELFEEANRLIDKFDDDKEIRDGMYIT
jgi:hypothetical protein